MSRKQKMAIAFLIILFGLTYYGFYLIDMNFGDNNGQVKTITINVSPWVDYLILTLISIAVPVYVVIKRFKRMD
jgi:hypothetical protein